MKATLSNQPSNTTALLKEQKVKILLIIFIACAFSFLAIYVFGKISKRSLLRVSQTTQPYCNLQAAQPGFQALSREQADKYMRCSPVAIYFKDTATDEQIKSLQIQVKKLQGVYYVEYISKEDGWKRYKEMNKGQPLETIPEVSMFSRSLTV